MTKQHALRHRRNDKCFYRTAVYSEQAIQAALQPGAPIPQAVGPASCAVPPPLILPLLLSSSDGNITIRHPLVQASSPDHPGLPLLHSSLEGFGSAPSDPPDCPVFPKTVKHPPKRTNLTAVIPIWHHHGLCLRPGRQHAPPKYIK